MDDILIDVLIHTVYPTPKYEQTETSRTEFTILQAQVHNVSMIILSPKFCTEHTYINCAVKL